MKSERLTAIHEASHVVLVVATIGKAHVGRVRLREPRERGIAGDARILHAPTLPAIAKMRVSFPLFAELAARHMIAILLAGHLGTHIARGDRTFKVPLRGDVNEAMNYAIGLPRRAFQQEARRTRRTLERHWSHVTKLAAVLLRKRRLTGREALAVLEGVGPIRSMRRRPLDRAANDELRKKLFRRSKSQP